MNLIEKYTQKELGLIKKAGIRLEEKDINVLGRTTQGVTLMRTNEGKVVSIETIKPEEEE